MKKIKKIFTSLFGILMVSFTKIGGIYTRAISFEPQPLYGIKEPEPTIGEKLLDTGKIIIPIILVIVGLIVILNKKLEKKRKILMLIILTVVTELIVLTILFL